MGDGKERDFWTTFRESHNPMVLVDSDRRIIEVNAAMRALTGRPAEQSTGRPIIDFIPPADRSLATRIWDRIESSGHAVDEHRLRTMSGGLLRFQYAAVRTQVPGRGEAFLAVAIEVSAILDDSDGTPAARIAPARLTQREDEIVRLVALGRTNNEIAAELFVSPETVRSHVRNAMEKTGARNRAHLVATQYAERLAAA